MEIKVIKNAGFCFGSKRAVGIVNDYADRGRPVFTYGPIVHNEIVTDELKEKGVGIFKSLEEAENIRDSVIVLRSHGLPKREYEAFLEHGKTHNCEIVDATCPFVKKIHRIVSEKSDEGYDILVAGNPEHPEVIGICGWVNGNCRVIPGPDSFEAENLDKSKKYCLVSQTTYNYKKFEQLVDILCKIGYDILVVNTICSATEIRQTETAELAGQCDAMIVIGGAASSNTRKLYEISKARCERTFYIQTHVDLDLELFKSFRCVGITAGASTPHIIIKEVQETMEENFEQMLNESFKTIHNGEVIEGTVIRVKEDEIALNIGYKADGIITRAEYTNTPNLDLRTVVNEGDVITAKILKVNDGDGQVALTYKRLAAERGSKRLEEAFENKEVLTAPVSAVLTGGICVTIDETRVFIPASLISDSYEKNLEKYKDQEIEFVITEFNPKRRRIIGDRKQLLVAKKAELMKALFEKIQIGDVIDGTVKNVTDFGAFIDLGGADGLLHISEMSWGRVENPKKVFKVGDTVTAFIKDIQGEKIALSLKFPDSNPWAGAEEKFAVGNVVTGKVARMTDFGAFVELTPGVDALLHVSQISRDRIEKPADVLKVGQEVTAKVLDFSLEDKKISLSMKALIEPEEAPADEAPVEEAPAEVTE